MIWRKPSNHSDDCYFCSLNVYGFNAKSRKGIIYRNIPSAMRSVLHGSGIPIPKPPEKLKDISSDSEEEDDSSDDDFNATGSNDPQIFSQSDLNDLVRDLGLPKNSAELLAKVKEGVFVGPDIRKLMKDEKFEACMAKVEKEAWSSYKEVINKFLGNYKDPNFKQIVQSMLENFKKLGCSCSLKVHFLMCHLDYFPEILGAVSEEHDERFHQDIKQMECRY
ncbi:hypothetical protein AVEN_111189-1 [Araneus ventricosus]|uniref:Uncharacterized protein n=1 Tax=Araneus ventricosus TaxID=182803 RepID=A0A4Y2T2M3_ARAVE|nr:hypothetical protein AVEN_111189-1 [Araneus ventricosus]